MTESKRRVAITGVGTVTAAGLTWEGLRERLWQAESAISEIDHFDAEAAPCRAGGQVRGFRLQDYAPPATLAALDLPDDRSMTFGCASMLSAVEDAKLEGAYAPTRVALSIGTGMAFHDIPDLRLAFGVFEKDRCLRRFLARLGPEFAKARRSADRLLADSVARRVADLFDFRGPCRAQMGTCAASSIAVIDGFQMIQRGEADACLVGGHDSMLNPVGLASFCLLGVVNTARKPATALVRPFDRDRAGMVIGEGAAVFVLERLDGARERGARVWGEVVGGGGSIDGVALTAPHPNGTGAVASMLRALRSAGLEPKDVDYINAHGTATEVNDPVEVKAMNTVFGPRAGGVPVSGSKSLFGHLIGACGAAELAVVLAALVDQRLPSTIGLDAPDHDCDLEHVLEPRRPRRLEYALSNSFGFGGYNGTVILRRAPR